MKEKRNAHKFFIGELEGKRPVRRHRRRWEDNIIMDLGETGWSGVGWIHLLRTEISDGFCDHSK